MRERQPHGAREGEAVRYIFDEFVLSPSEQRLRRGEQVVRLGGRPMEILTALVERAGQIVSKEDLTKRAWPRTTVDASNLKVNIAAIRRALEGSRPEKRFIATVSGQGYRFVEPVDIAPFPALTAARRHILPPPPDLHGRAEDLVEIPPEVLRRPLVTITAPGGVGKTSLALAVGHMVAGRFRDGVRMVDLRVVDSDRFNFQDDDAPTVVEICRRLDGLPRALELAATRIGAFGLRGLVRLLSERLDLLDGGRRAGHPRHHGLTAMLDWSRGLLSPDEQALFRRVFVHHGIFSLDAALAVSRPVGEAGSDGVSLLADLVAKSLVTAVPGPLPRFRLLDTTRDYGLRRLLRAARMMRCAGSTQSSAFWNVATSRPAGARRRTPIRPGI